VNTGVGREQRGLIDVLEDRAIGGTESWESIAQQLDLPIANGANAVDEHEAPHGSLIAFRREHRESTTP
jgi:hypothetical protein